jgi:beta-glucosidase
VLQTAARDFPADFLWGAATSSHQVEGDNRGNDWWQHEQAGRLPHRSGAATEHYRRYPEDFDLARSWGHNAHRLSLEWSRIEPAPGEWSIAALEHYARVIGALRERGLEPVVTLHHFTNPAWFTAAGGWLQADAAARFERYARQVAARLGDQVRYWLTINEPTVAVMQGYMNGDWPPFRKGAWREAIRALRQLARAHVAAWRALHEQRSDCLAGFAHNSPAVEPCDPASARDRLAAALREALLNRAFFALIGAWPGRRGKAVPLDFIGLNYYYRIAVRSTGWGPRGLLGRVCHQPHHRDQGPLSTIGWEVYPRGLKDVVERFAARHGRPLLITENGIATDDEEQRARFLHDHLASLAAAMQGGAPVIGYLYWSLIDNYEWTDGYAARFGLAAVDFATQERTPRPCATVLAAVCRSGRLPSLADGG